MLYLGLLRKISISLGCGLIRVIKSGFWLHTQNRSITRTECGSAFPADLVITWWLSKARGFRHSLAGRIRVGHSCFPWIFPILQAGNDGRLNTSFAMGEVLHRHIPRRARNPKINTIYHFSGIVISYFKFNLVYSNCFAQAFHWDFHFSSSPTKAYSKPESPACRTAGRLHESLKGLRPMLDGLSDFRWFSFVYNTHPAIAIGCSSSQSRTCS